MTETQAERILIWLRRELERQQGDRFAISACLVDQSTAGWLAEQLGMDCYYDPMDGDQRTGGWYRFGEPLPSIEESDSAEVGERGRQPIIIYDSNRGATNHEPEPSTGQPPAAVRADDRA